MLALRQYKKQPKKITFSVFSLQTCIGDHDPLWRMSQLNNMDTVISSSCVVALLSILVSLFTDIVCIVIISYLKGEYAFQRTLSSSGLYHMRGIILDHVTMPTHDTDTSV